jgi:hypothetical protein
MVVSNRGERIGFPQSVRRNAMLFLISIPWPVATVIALSRIAPAQYLELWGNGESALEVSLRPEWYAQFQQYVHAALVVDVLLMVISKRQKSLHTISAVPRLSRCNPSEPIEDWS